MKMGKCYDEAKDTEKNLRKKGLIINWLMIIISPLLIFIMIMLLGIRLHLKKADVAFWIVFVIMYVYLGWMCYYVYSPLGDDEK